MARADLWVYNAENFCVSFFYQVTSIFHLRRGGIKKNFGLPNIEPINLYNIVINLFQSDATRLLLSSYTSFLESFTPLRPLASEISSIMPIALQSLQKERLHKKNCIKKKCQDLAASSRVLPRPAQYLTNSTRIFSLISPDHQMGCSAERLLCSLRTSSSKISVVEL